MKRYYYDHAYRFSHTAEANPGSFPAPNATEVAVPEVRSGFEILYNPDAKQWFYKTIDTYATRKEKLAEFDAIFTRLDALKIRPAASIAEALAAAEPIPAGDAYRLSELEAITAENRSLRGAALTAETVEAVRAVQVWWPEEE